MKAVNLLPRDARSRPGVSFGTGSAPFVAAGGVALCVVVALTAAFVVTHARAAAEQKKLAAARAQLETIATPRPPRSKPGTTTPIIPVPAVTRELAPRLDALSQALGTRIAWDRVLREFSLVVPSDVTVSELKLDSSAGFDLTGLTYSQDSVARLLSRLSLIPDLDSVSLENSSADPASGQVTFSIKAALKTAPTVVTGA